MYTRILASGIERPRRIRIVTYGVTGHGGKEEKAWERSAPYLSDKAFRIAAGYPQAQERQQSSQVQGSHFSFISRQGVVHIIDPLFKYQGTSWKLEAYVQLWRKGFVLVEGFGTDSREVGLTLVEWPQ